MYHLIIFDIFPPEKLSSFISLWQTAAIWPFYAALIQFCQGRRVKYFSFHLEMLTANSLHTQTFLNKQDNELEFNKIRMSEEIQLTDLFNHILSPIKVFFILSGSLVFQLNHTLCNLDSQCLNFFSHFSYTPASLH